MNYSKFLTLLIFIIFVLSCENKNEDIFNAVFAEGELAQARIISVSDVRDTTAIVVCALSSKGKGYISARGVCWATTTNPTIEKPHTATVDTGNIAMKLTKLNLGTTYYVRPYITNNAGTSYGTEYYFLTKNTPTITTSAPTNLTAISATITGTVTNDGGDSVTVRGVCWGTTTKPTISLTTKTTNGAGKGTFNTELTGLTIGTTYFARAFASNLYGTSYSNEITFTTQNLPILTTTTVTNITTVTATSGGTITSDGGSTVIARGICWSTTQNPTTDLITKTIEGIGLATFTSSMVNLQLGTTYYVRAYATNALGTSYGAQQIFKTNSYSTITTNATSNITSSTASCGGNISSDGGSNVTSRGICWNTSTNPSISLSTKTVDGSGTGSFTSSITGLLPGTTYYARAYATNTAGTEYGSNISFTTLSVIPTVTTTAISGITTTSAISGGSVTYDGGAIVTARGICWSTSSTPTISNNKTSDANGTGTFASSITGLVASTTYYVRAYAINSAGIAYGSLLSFTTSVISLPTLTTTDISSITNTTASSGGVINTDGGAIVTARGVCWSTTPNPTISNSKTSDGAGNGIFTSSITFLSANTVYFLRAYATNTIGTSYGPQLSFTTSLALAPTISTATISSIKATTAISGGTISSDGGSIVTAKGVCWSTSSTPTITDSSTSNGSGVASFISSLTGLSTNTTYYIRAYATNSIGTSYGNQLIFKTIISYSIGASYLGGKIAYLDASGIHGFVCALANQSTGIAWWNGNNITTGATNTVLETAGVYGISKSGGRKNTDAIIATQGSGNYAASICASLTTGDAKAGEWYLPSKGELNQIYINRTIIGGFTIFSYWSSSENDNSSAWCQLFYDSSPYINNKTISDFCVRAIRAF
jgi:hypothetical protein